MTKPPAGAEGCSRRLLYPAGGKRQSQNPRHGTHRREVYRGRLVLCALDFGLGRSALFERECRFWRPGFYLKLRPYMKPHAGLAPAPLRVSGAHPPADRRRWLCDIVSGLYATTQWGCAAGMWLELGGIKHGHAHTGYMIAAGCCACLTIPWYQDSTSFWLFGAIIPGGRNL